MKKVLAMAFAAVLGLCSASHATEMNTTGVSGTSVPDIGAAQRNFEGFYVGVNGGAVMQSDNFSAESYVLGRSRDRFEGRFQKGSGELGVVIGGQKILGQILGGQAYWGFEGGVSKDLMKAQNSGALSDAGQSYRIDAAFSKNSSFHIAQKFGLLFKECWGVYVKIGAVNTNFKYDLKSAIAPFPLLQLSSGSTRQNLWGFEIGLGSEYAMTEHWHFNVEYVYQSYQKFDHKFEGAAPGRYVTVNVGPKYHRLSVGLNYKF